MATFRLWFRLSNPSKNCKVAKRSLCSGWRNLPECRLPPFVKAMEIKDLSGIYICLAGTGSKVAKFHLFL